MNDNNEIELEPTNKQLDLTINTPRTDVNNDEDDEDEQRLDDGEGEGEYGGGGYGDTEDSNRSPQHLTDRDRHYPYTSDTHLNKLKNVNSNNSLNNHSNNNSRSNNYNHNRNQGPSKQSVVHHNKSSSLGRGSETSNKSPTNTTTNTDSSKSPTTHTNTETPTGHHQQQQPQQQQPTKYPQEAQSTYRVPIHNTTNNNHPYNATTTTNHSNPVASQPPRQIAAPVAAPNNNPNPRHQIMSDINNHQQQQQPQQQHSTTNNHQQHYSEPSYNSTNQYKHLDPTNPDNNHISSLLASGDLELEEPQPDFYLGEPESNSNAQRQRFNMMQSPAAANYMNRKPPNNLPPLSNIGLVDLATNQFSSASLLSSQQQQQPQLQAQRSNPSLMTNPNIMTTNPASFSAHPSFNNSTNPMMMMNPASNSLPLGYRSSQMPINIPLGRSEPFDALQTRRRLLNEMSQTNLRMPSFNNGVNAIRPSAQYPLNSVIETRMAPLGSNNLVGAALNETLVSNDVDDLIDVMAKRRIAIKKLENEMYRQHSRASSMIRPSYDDQLMKTASQMNLRYVDPYSLNDRSSRAGQMMMQQGPPPPPGLLSYENPLVAGRTPSMINSMGDLTSRPNALNLISNLDYPSESNREIYSTYLVDSIRPHYSAKRLLNGIRPGPPGSSVPRPQHTSSLYNNQQPVNSYGLGGLGDDLDLFNDPFDADNLLLNAEALDYVPRTNFFTPITNRDNNMHLNGGGIQTPSLIDRSISNFSNTQNKKYNTMNQQKPGTLNKARTESPIRNSSSPPTHDINNNHKNRPQNVQKSNFTNTKIDDSDDSERKKQMEINRDLLNDSELKLRYDKQEKESKHNNRKSLAGGGNKANLSKSPSIMQKPKNNLATRFPRLHDRGRVVWAPGTIVRFLIRIKNKAKQNADKNKNRTGSAALFRTRLLEIMTALHRVYLEPEGPIYTSIMEFVKNPNDLSALFNPSSPIYDSCVNVVCQNIEEIITHITEFMPKEGVVGTTSRSALLSLISEGNRFPDNYFWDVEKERLRFDEFGKIRNITRGRAILILLSAMVSRALITTLLIKPVKFRLLRGDLPANQRNNLKILATIMCFLVRCVNDTSNKKLEFPWEWQSSMFNDAKMDSIYNNAKIKTSLDRCQKSLATWAGEYVSRLDETSGLKR